MPSVSELMTIVVCVPDGVISAELLVFFRSLLKTLLFKQSFRNISFLLFYVCPQF